MLLWSPQIIVFKRSTFAGRSGSGPGTRALPYRSGHRRVCQSAAMHTGGSVISSQVKWYALFGGLLVALYTVSFRCGVLVQIQGLQLVLCSWN